MARNEPARPADRSVDPVDDRSEIWRDADSAWFLSVELLTATFVWGGIGWVVDTYVLHSSPYAMITGFLIGFALGMYLLYLRMQDDGRREDARRANWRAGATSANWRASLSGGQRDQPDAGRDGDRAGRDR